MKEIKDHLPGIYEVLRPSGAAGPLVFDSPHSGSIYPEDFGYSCDELLLRRAEDTIVDRLFGSAPDQGSVFLKSLFPRTYIDANRTTDDIDEDLLAEAWPQPVARDGRSSAGHGLIRRLIRPGYPIYDRKLTVREVETRIRNYYIPYHDALGALLDKTHYDHGQVWHINCHSMPSSSAYTSSGMGFRSVSPDNRVDIVLGTRDGTTCDADFAREVRSFLQTLGYRVAINNPYKGMELLRRYADPVRGRHSLQIEISKALYLNEDTNEANTGFMKVQGDMTKLIGFMHDYVSRTQIPQAAD